MVARLLEVAGAVDVGGEVTPVERGVDPVAAALDHESGYLDRGEHGAYVDLPDHAEHAEERARTDRHALESAEQLAGAGRV